MNTKSSIVVVVFLALLLSACAPNAQSLILGKWQADSVVKLQAQFNRDGTASITMMGQTLQGTYKLGDGNELEWSMSGITTKAKVNVTATELDVTDDQNRTIKYKRM